MKKLELDLNTVKTMLDEGKSQTFISKYYNCSQASIVNFCKKHGLKSQHLFHKSKDLVGKQYNCIKVIKLLGLNKKVHPTSNIWQCECRCGKVLEMATYHLAEIQSCGCLQKEQKYIQQSTTWKGYEEISSTFYSRLKREAKERDIKFDLSIEFLWDLFVKQERKCKLTKMELFFKFGPQEQTASLDRINSDLGYTEDNVQWVHKDVNWMKQDYDQKRYIEICKLVASNN